MYKVVFMNDDEYQYHIAASDPKTAAMEAAKMYQCAHGWEDKWWTIYSGPAWSVHVTQIGEEQVHEFIIYGKLVPVFQVEEEK